MDYSRPQRQRHCACIYSHDRRPANSHLERDFFSSSKWHHCDARGDDANLKHVGYMDAHYGRQRVEEVGIGVCIHDGRRASIVELEAPGHGCIVNG